MLIFAQNLRTIPASAEEQGLKGALNPNFLNLTINREKFWL